MNKKQEINPAQLLCSIILIQFGSAILLDPSNDAGKNSWIVILLGTIFGVGIYFIYLGLFKYYPEIPLTSYVQELWGKFLGKLVALLYISYFIYISGRILRDFSELLVITSYPNTTIFVIGLIMITCISYIVMKGLNSIARVSIFCLSTVLIVLILFIIAGTISGIFQFSRALPTLEYGWSRVIQSLFPKGILVPFGEMIIFTMILPFLNRKEKAKKIGIAGIVFSGVYLAISSVLNLSVLGDKLTMEATFPIFSAVSIINIADFITHVAALIVFTTVVLGFFKISVFFYCAVLGTKNLFNIKKNEYIILPIGFIIFFSSVVSSLNFTSHINEGLSTTVYYLHIPFQIIIPILLLITAFIKNKLKQI